MKKTIYSETALPDAGKLVWQVAFTPGFQARHQKWFETKADAMAFAKSILPLCRDEQPMSWPSVNWYPGKGASRYGDKLLGHTNAEKYPLYA